MPWSIKKRGDKWVVVKDDDGKVVGTHPTKEAARRQQKALYANESSKVRRKKKKR